MELFLELTDWDLVADANGSIATCSDGYDTAQAVANEIKLFKGEGWYDPNQGCPHFSVEFGQPAQAGAISSMLVAAAKRVPGVVSAQCNLSINRTTRKLGGVVIVTTTEGVTYNVAV